MSEIVLVLGRSGTGKSFSCRDLDPKKTLLVSVEGKRYPFKMEGWQPLTQENPKGSIYIPRATGAKAYQMIKGATEQAVKEGKKVIVLDDTSYLMSNEYFHRAFETGYGKFAELGKSFHDLIGWARTLPDDVVVYFLHHSESTETGDKVKTTGKMLDCQTCIEGMFTICINAAKVEDEYVFRSSVSGESIYKAPPGLTPDGDFSNNLAELDGMIRGFWNI